MIYVLRLRVKMGDNMTWVDICNLTGQAETTRPLNPFSSMNDFYYKELFYVTHF